MLKKNLTTMSQDSRNSYRSSQAYDGYANSMIIGEKNRQISSTIANKSISSGDIVAAVDHEERVSNVIDGESRILNAINELTKKYSTEDMNTQHSISTSNKSENTLINIAVEDNSTGTFAPSDPEKTTSVSDELSYLYKIKKQEKARETYKVPKDAPRINTAVNSYRDSRSMRYLTDDNIAEISEEGIITVNQGVSNMPSFKLIPEEDLIQIPIENKDRKMTPYSYTDIVAGTDSYHENTVPDGIRANRQKRYYYKIGLDNIFLGRKSVNSAGGFISSPIRVNNCTWISLSTDYKEAEYYIIDNKDEISILPDTQEKIVGEKLFFGLMPRFPIEEQDDFVVKKNGIVTSINTIPDLRLFLFSKTSEEGKSSYETVNNYTIDYVPPLSYRRYTPKSETIRIKIILRANDIQIPKITKCQINIHQPENKWAMSSIEDMRLKYGSW